MDVLTPEQRRANMAAIRGRDTKPELTVRRLVHRLGYRYVLHSRKLPGHPDLTFPARKKIIFVHGCYWHMHDCRWGAVVPRTRSEFWQAKRSANVERDTMTEQALNKMGWSVLVVWECETKCLDLLTERVHSFLGQ